MTISNDTFANRTALSGFDIGLTGSTIGFTGELGEPNHAGVSGSLSSAWWSWLAPDSGRVELNTFGSNYDTTLAVYTGDVLGDLTEVASNDDSRPGLQSAVAFDAIAGTTYQIAVDGFATGSGTVALNLDLTSPVNNDNFANRFALNGLSDSDSLSNSGYTGEPDESNHAEASGPLNSAWWYWIAPTSGQVRLNTRGSSFDTTLAVYTGDALDTLTEVASNDDVTMSSTQSAVVFEATAGTTYQIAVDGFSGSTGDIDLNLNLRVSSNDAFADRVALVGSSFNVRGTTVGFTGEVGEPDHAEASGALNSSWWSWTAPTSGEIILNTTGSNFDTTLAVYTGDTLNTLTEVASNDDSAGTTQSLVTFDAVAGTTYQIAVDGFGGSAGNFFLNLATQGPSTGAPTDPVDLILDFDGGTLQSGQGYDIPTPDFAGFDFAGFTAFDGDGGSAGNLNEQILQIVAGVREDFADFNVRVIWDDRGVDSPFYDSQDTVLMTVGDGGGAVGQGGIFGIAANVDVPQFTGDPLQSRRDVGFAFRPAHVDVGPNNFNEIRELIDTISHEAGHTFGLSHTPEADSESRQLVTTGPQNRNLDSRFSPEVLNLTAPETGMAYAETERLTAAVGAAPTASEDDNSGQTLPLEPRTTFVGTLSPTDPLTASGSIDFAGDRDAFRFLTTAAGDYTVTQTTTDMALTPVLTLWDSGGEFVALGAATPTGGGSSITFTAAANESYYAIAGSEADRVGSGVLPTAQTGDYTLAFS